MRKPKIKIVRSPYERPGKRWIFVVKWPGNHFKNSQWFTFEESLVAAGVTMF